MASTSQFGITGDKLVVNGDLDYEEEDTLLVQVIGLDSGIPQEKVGMGTVQSHVLVFLDPSPQKSQRSKYNVKILKYSWNPP